MVPESSENLGILKTSGNDNLKRIYLHDWYHRRLKSMEIAQSIYDALVTGPAYSFAEGLHSDIPLARPGVYTIWKGAEFLYVGVAGRALDLSVEYKQVKGLRDRLDSHWRGRRSGDQFAVYVCDRLVLPSLTPEQIRRIAAGELSLDALTRVYIHHNLSYRFAVTPDYNVAMRVESQFCKGETPIGSPLLNPKTGRTPLVRRNGGAK